MPVNLPQKKRRIRRTPTSGPSTPAPGNPSVRQSSGVGLWILLAVLVLVLGGVGVGYVILNAGRTDSDPQSTDSPPAASEGGRTTLAAHGPAATQPVPTATAKTSAAGLAVTYRLPRSGDVSAAVFNPQGVLVRTLLRATPHDAGEHRLQWDGLDRLGRPQPPGDYTVRILCKPPFQREFIMQVGVNPQSKPYHRWVGNYLGGTSVAIDSSGIYLGSGHTENGLILIKQSLDGKKRMWTARNVHPHQGPISLGTDGKTVYALQWNAFIALFDAETGKHTGLWDVLPKSKRDKFSGKGRSVRRKRRSLRYTKYKFVLPQMDLAVSGKTRVVTDERENTVQWLGDKGEIVAEATVPSPRGVAIGPDRTVYVISGSEVKSVTKRGRTKTVIRRGLTNPFRLAYEPAQGDLLVADGPDDWRVKRYSLAGKFKRAYGRKGGREDGPYEPRDFHDFKELTADGQGGFYVGEPRYAPRRIAHLDANGRVLQEWFGGLPFFSPRSIDPRDPTKMWYSADGLILVKLDYEKRTWRILETHRIGGKAAGLASGRHYTSNSMFQTRYHDGKRYLVGESFPPSVFRHKNGRLEPLVLGNRGGHFPDAKQIAQVMTGSRDEKKINEWIRTNLGKKTRKKNAYLWTDNNGDRIPQAKEIVLRKLGNVYHGPGMGVSIGSTFSVIFGNGYYNPLRKKEGQPNQCNGIGRLMPKGWENGIPQYRLPDKAAAMDVARLHTEPHSDTDSRAKVRHTFEDSDGALYAFYDWAREGRAFGGFPTYQAGRYARLTKWNADGTRRWSVGRKAMGAPSANRGQFNPTAPGCFHYPTRIGGEVRGTIVVFDRVVNPGMAWTKDGLFAGSFFPGRVKDGLPGMVYKWQMDWETGRDALVNHDCMEGGAIAEHKGHVYFLSPGRESVVVYRVHGYDVEKWTRISETVRLAGSPASAKAEGNGLIARFYRGTEIKGRPHVGPQKADLAALYLPEPIDNGKAYAVRLTGLLEAPLTEKYKVSVSGGAARMWLDGKLVVDYWNEASRYGSGGSTDYLALRAGRRYRLQIDLIRTKPQKTESGRKKKKPSIAHLRWASKNTDMNDVPKRFLYAEDVKISETLTPRPAARMIQASSFDYEISSKDLYYDDFHWRQHIKNLKSGNYAGYRSIDFGSGVSAFCLHLRGSQSKGEKLELRIDKPNGRRVGTVEIPELNARYGVETVHKTKIRGLSGVHDLYLVSTAGRGVHFRAFRFE